MNYDKIDKVKKELAQLPTFTERLNYWKKNYYNNGSKWLREYFEFKSKEEKGTNFHDRLSGELMLPIDENKLILELHPPSNGIQKGQRIEYYRWMLFFLAEKIFDYRIKPVLTNQYTSPLGEDKLKGRYNRIKAVQEKAKNALKQGTLEIRLVNKPSDEELFLWYADDLYSRVEIPIQNMENTHVRSVCDHHYVFPYLKELLNRRSSLNEGKIKLSDSLNFNISSLAEELRIRGYFDSQEKEHFIDWCTGIQSNSKISIKKPMNHFVSVISSLIENKIFTNSKKECYSIIHTQFLFNGEVAEIQSIENAMKPKNSNNYRI